MFENRASSPFYKAKHQKNLMAGSMRTLSDWLLTDWLTVLVSYDTRWVLNNPERVKVFIGVVAQTFLVALYFITTFASYIHNQQKFWVLFKFRTDELFGGPMSKLHLRKHYLEFLFQYEVLNTFSARLIPENDQKIAEKKFENPKLTTTPRLPDRSFQT